MQTLPTEQQVATTDEWRFRGDIEGLRAVAIVLVVLFHAGVAGMRGGFLGVDVFFVISGYLIVGLLLAEVRQSGTLSLSRFWARRARRLLPAATLVAVVTLVLSSMLAAPDDRLSLSGTAASFSVYASNLVFARRDADYFRHTSPDPLLHTWSLSVEEQYYLFFAPLLLGIAWAVRRWTRAGTPDAASLALKVLLGLGLASLVGFVMRWRLDWISAFYLSPYRVWEFGAGAIVAAGSTPNTPKWQRAGTIAWASLGIVVVSALVLTSRTRHLSLLMLPAVAATALIIASGGDGNGTSLSRLLDAAPMRWLGRVSYSWYLWHWPLLILLSEVIEAPSVALKLAVAVAALLPATASLYLVEAPIRSSRWLAAKPHRSLIMAAALALVTVTMSAVVRKSARRDLASADYAFIRDAAVLPAIVADGCHADRSTVGPKDCVFGRSNADTTIALFGDSHAAQWFPALELLASRRHWRVISFTKTSCPATWAAVNDVDLGRPYTECEQWRSAVLEKLARQRPLLTIVSNYHGYEVELRGKPRPLSTPEGAAYWESGLRSMLQNLTSSGTHVIVLQDPPRPLNDPTRCVKNHFRNFARCYIRIDTVADGTAYTAERSASGALRGVSYVELNPLRCREERCETVKEGVAIFRDSHHLSAPFVRSLAPQLDRAISDVLGVAPMP